MALSRNFKFSNLHKSLTQHAPIDEKTLKSEKVFRGFLPGSLIKTSKGFCGNALDSLWSRHLMTSFMNDDNELADIAMKSVLADPTVVVEGGEIGCPFYIGNFGFYAKCQFDMQANFLKQNERDILADDHTIFLSQAEWKVVDTRLSAIAEYGDAKIQKVVRGDTLIMVAIRLCAFDVATVLLSKKVELLASNENGEDFLELTRERYSVTCSELVDINNEKIAMAQTTIVPSKLDELLAKDEILIITGHKMLHFLTATTECLNKRQIELEQCKWTKRKADLRKENVAYEISWLISQEPNILRMLQVIGELIDYMTAKLKRHLEHSAEIDIEGTLRIQQDQLHASEDIDKLSGALKHLQPQYNSSFRIISKKDLATKKAKRNKKIKNQLVYSIDEFGNKIYDYSDFKNDDEEKCGPAIYVQEKTDTSTIMLR